jgi:hypothetical protein
VVFLSLEAGLGLDDGWTKGGVMRIDMDFDVIGKCANKKGGHYACDH